MLGATWRSKINFMFMKFHIPEEASRTKHEAHFRSTETLSNGGAASGFSTANPPAAHNKLFLLQTYEIYRNGNHKNLYTFYF